MNPWLKTSVALGLCSGVTTSGDPPQYLFSSLVAICNSIIVYLPKIKII